MSTVEEVKKEIAELKQTSKELDEYFEKVNAFVEKYLTEFPFVTADAYYS